MKTDRMMPGLASVCDVVAPQKPNQRALTEPAYQLLE
jgi:hypothetical protein